MIVIDLKVSRFSYADAGQMHLYLNFAREHRKKEGENPPVGLILYAEKGTAEAQYALDNLPNKVLAAEYQMVLPDARVIADELKRSKVQLEARRISQINRTRSVAEQWSRRPTCLAWTPNACERPIAGNH